MKTFAAILLASAGIGLLFANVGAQDQYLDALNGLQQIVTSMDATLQELKADVQDIKATLQQDGCTVGNDVPTSGGNTGTTSGGGDITPFSPTDSGDFTHQAALDEYDRYILLWKFDSDTITFEAHVQTTGFIGLGFSPNGGMTGSDVIIGWVKDGQAYLTDRYAEGYFLPRLDASQDVELLSGYENGTHTVLRFRRRLRPCDTADDREITEDTVRIIWSFNDNDPAALEGPDGPQYHGSSRGSKSIILLQKTPPNLDLQEGNVLTFDMTNPNVRIPSRETTYWCSSYQLPVLDKKHHLVKVEPIIQPGNEGVVHHILVYQCTAGSNPPSGSQECASMPWGQCRAVMAAWAVGGTGYTYPDHVGFSLGTADDPSYVVMQTHYDNPQRLNDVYDNSGMRFYYTPDVRQYDAGILEVGVQVSQNHAIPPKADTFDSTAFCYKECLDPFLQELGEPIHVFASMLHAHQVGVGVRTKLVRNGVLETYVGRDDNYDFNLQETRFLYPEVTIKEGDELITECSYRTTDKDGFTFGGEASSEEMCQNYLQYYPRFKLDHCDSLPYIMHGLNYFGITQIDNNLHVVKPDSLAGMNIGAVMNQHPWTVEEAERLDQHIRNGPVVVRCKGLPGYTNLAGITGQRFDPLPEPIVLMPNSTAIPGC
ncbi:DBH-like monooxygenase protein 1 [Branchiostoma floridae x Branchiostoma belcheri]